MDHRCECRESGDALSRTLSSDTVDLRPASLAGGRSPAAACGRSDALILTCFVESSTLLGYLSGRRDLGDRELLERSPRLLRTDFLRGLGSFSISPHNEHGSWRVRTRAVTRPAVADPSEIGRRTRQRRQCRGRRNRNRRSAMPFPTRRRYDKKTPPRGGRPPQRHSKMRNSYSRIPTRKPKRNATRSIERSRAQERTRCIELIRFS